MLVFIRQIFLYFIVLVFSNNLLGQVDSIHHLRFFEPSPVFHKSRFWTVAGVGGSTYTAFSIGFYNSWYKSFPTSSFHLFNDAKEWQQMDKAGHVFGGYLQSVICYQGAKWTGLSESKSILTGALCGTLFQTTIEMMDGFSTKWGFSISDIAANSLGVGSFVLQQKYWGGQRIKFKESVRPLAYNDDIILSANNLGSSSLKKRTDDLYGKTWGEKALKDYNVQTYWASFNVHEFLVYDNSWPQWLNLALGYGAGGMYGGFENEWEEDGLKFKTSEKRYRQFYIALDYNLTKIKTKHHFVKGALTVLDIIKYPAPAIEINTKGEVLFHLVFF